MSAPDVLSTIPPRNRRTPRRRRPALGRERAASEAATPPPATTSLRLVQGTDDYTGAITGVHVDAIRIGSGATPSCVLDVIGERMAVTTCEIGFPMVTHSHVPDHQIVVAFMLEAGRMSRSCAVGLRPGMAMVYGPGAEHLAVNHPGLRFTFGVAGLDLLAELADRTEAAVEIPSDGSVQHFPASPATQAVGDALCGFTDAGLLGGPLVPASERVLRSLVALLGADTPRRLMGHGQGIDSRRIIHDCLEFATSTARIPSLNELCAAASVSERRLRAAFTDEFDLPPSRFFRAWALGEAHRRLREAAPGQVTVTQVATELGFGHLGRFAGHYRQLYGEAPSTTLRSPSQLIAESIDQR